MCARSVSLESSRGSNESKLEVSVGPFITGMNGGATNKEGERMRREGEREREKESGKEGGRERGRGRKRGGRRRGRERREGKRRNRRKKKKRKRREKEKGKREMNKRDTTCIYKEYKYS